MKSVKIYSLKHPITKEIRYIGKTSQSLKTRLYQHIYEATKKGFKTHKISWIKSLKNKGLIPVIDIIEEVPESEVNDVEKYWIQQLKLCGYKLTNLTDGGDGNQNQRMTAESNKKRSETLKRKVKEGLIDYSKRSHKISKALTGIKRSEKTKQLLRDINKGKKQSKSTRLKKSKPVIQLTTENVFVKEWDILNEASRELNISKGAISNVCKGRQKTAGGFKWEYKK